MEYRKKLLSAVLLATVLMMPTEQVPEFRKKIRK